MEWVEKMSKENIDDTAFDADAFEVDEDPLSLGSAAAEAVSILVTESGKSIQEPLDGTEYLKVKFVGMAFDSLDKDIKIGDEMSFLVRARCTGTAIEASKTDGSLRHIAKMDVQSVVLDN